MGKLSKWICECGQHNRSNFCSICGEKAPHDVWICQCSTLNDTPSCSHCGLSRHAKTHRICDRCGFELDGVLNQTNEIKNCPSCGDEISHYDQEWTI